MYLTQSLHRATHAPPDTLATRCGERRHTYAAAGVSGTGKAIHGAFEHVRI